MYTFDDLPAHSRVWIYQAEEEFSNEQKQHIKDKMVLFLNNWAAHGATLKAAIKIVYDRFIIIMVDEDHAKATGCSIDKSMHLIKQLQEELGVSLLNRLQVAYRKDNEISTFHSSQINDKLQSKEIQDTTVIFNNTVSTKEDWEKNWEIPLQDSWLKAIA